MTSEVGDLFGGDLRLAADPIALMPSEKSIPMDIPKSRETPEQLCYGGHSRKLLHCVLVGY